MKRMIIGMTGATGAVYGKRLLEVLRQAGGWETHLVVSDAGALNIQHELGLKRSEIYALADKVHGIDDIAASIASGGFRTEGMIVAPCSIRTASEIACGVTSTLMSRAADVALKDRRRVVLMVRETPLHTGHLRTLTQLSEIGAIIAPPLPAFYTRPETVDDIVDHSVGRVLDLFDIEAGLVKRWREPGSDARSPRRKK